MTFVYANKELIIVVSFYVQIITLRLAWLTTYFLNLMPSYRTKLFEYHIHYTSVC